MTDAPRRIKRQDLVEKELLQSIDSPSHDRILAKRLADNEKPVRDRAVRLLRTFIASRSFSDLEMLKIWKGLFYCMWMSDKPLIQQELAETLASLTLLFESPEMSVLYLHTFWKTMMREWHGLDRLRLDKYYYLMHQMYATTMSFLNDHEWRGDLLDAFHRIYTDTVFNTEPNVVVPMGLTFHVLENYFSTLTTMQSKFSPPDAVLRNLVRPVATYVVRTKSQMGVKKFEEMFLGPILEWVAKERCVRDRVEVVMRELEGTSVVEDGDENVGESGDGHRNKDDEGENGSENKVVENDVTLFEEEEDGFDPFPDSDSNSDFENEEEEEEDSISPTTIHTIITTFIDLISDPSSSTSLPHVRGKLLASFRKINEAGVIALDERVQDVLKPPPKKREVPAATVLHPQKRKFKKKGQKGGKVKGTKRLKISQ